LTGLGITGVLMGGRIAETAARTQAILAARGWALTSSASGERTASSTLSTSSSGVYVSTSR
jgi:hypothetical protein